jgi:hypothetical protein
MLIPHEGWINIPVSPAPGNPVYLIAERPAFSLVWAAILQKKIMAKPPRAGKIPVETA